MVEVRTMKFSLYGNNNNNNNNNARTIFIWCCHHVSIARVHPGLRDECSTAPGGRRPLDQADRLEP